MNRFCHNSQRPQGKSWFLGRAAMAEERRALGRLEDEASDAEAERQARMGYPSPGSPPPPGLPGGEKGKPGKGGKGKGEIPLVRGLGPGT